MYHMQATCILIETRKLVAYMYMHVFDILYHAGEHACLHLDHVEYASLASYFHL